MGNLEVFIKFAPIVILYVFIVRIAYAMIKDLKGSHELPQHWKELKEENPRGQYFLSVIDSDESEIPRGKEVSLNNSLSVGRGGQNDVVIRDAYISHEHARIIRTSKGYLIEDLKSLNGVFVNDSKILKPTILELKDKIKVGGVTFQFMRWENEVQ
jgi:pSer/pThr/pTyr-binding forkhead associated (FHA) protein